MMYLTQREEHIIVLFLLVLIGVVLSGLDQMTLEAYSIPFCIFIVMPAGLYLATDPERRRSS
jgi:hypothetical protein